MKNNKIFLCGFVYDTTQMTAEEIKADPERYKNAQLGAKEVLEERSKELAGYRKVSGKQKSLPQQKQVECSSLPVGSARDYTDLFNAVVKR